ncbi:MAG: NUDIX hydrolase [Oscillospiraceae bacterium]|nr:NUDIX hydrolase [Oscillospiraceae bacterium]
MPAGLAERNAMEQLIAQIENYIPFNAQEIRDKAQILTFLRSGSELITRENPVAHLTASAWVVSPDRSQVIMVYHNLYNSWSWMGGHADGNWDLLQVAKKEVMEECGLRELTVVSPDIFSLEILCVAGHEKKGQYLSSHLHLNVTYLFEADPAQPLRIKPDENSGVGWVRVEDIPCKTNEAWFRDRIYSKLQEKAAI